MKFGTRVRLKPSNDQGEFEIDRVRSKNNIAEISIALGHETDNKYTLPQTKALSTLGEEGRVRVWGGGTSSISHNIL